MAHRERVSAGGQHRDRGPGDHGLLEVKALEQVKQPQGQHQCDRRLQGAAAPLEQVGRDEQQRGTERERHRVKQADRLDGLERQQEVASPSDVGRQRRPDVDQADHRTAQSGKARQPW
jgi:hypothetical protein